MFSLDETPRITKEFLLSKNSPETYMEYYLGVPVKRGLFCSPSIIRKDSKPTCSFYKNKKGDVIYKDFAGPTFNFIGAVMYIFNCSYPKALKIIANDFGYLKIPNYEVNLPRIIPTGNVLKNTERAIIQVEVKNFSEKELTWWGSFGVPIKTLNKFKVFSIKHVFLNGIYFTSSTESSPIFGYYGGENLEGYEFWRIYMPTKRNYRFLSNWPSSMVQGAKYLPKAGNHCFIIKSYKDVMNLYEFGFISCAPTSENILITQHQIDKITNLYKNIIIFFDNDLAGVKNANKYKKKYKLKCIFIKRKYAKDISDLYKKVSNTVFWTIVEELNLILNDSLIRQTKHFYIF